MKPAFWQTETADGRSSTSYPDFDFETYSEAGYVWGAECNKWRGLTANKRGLAAVGATAYSEHPSTELLSLSYNLKMGDGPKLWVPGAPPPTDLFQYLETGGPIEAWNWFFEYSIWKNVCVERLGWPPIQVSQFIDAMAKSRAYSLPGSLGTAGEVTGLGIQKLKEGDALIRKLCIPKNPSKKEPFLRRTPASNPDDFIKFYQYNLGDIAAETAVSEVVPDLIPFEVEVFEVDKAINARGVCIDHDTLKGMLKVTVDYTAAKQNELRVITNDKVQTASEVQKITEFCAENGLHVTSLAKDVLPGFIDQATGAVKKVLQIRQALASASIKKAPTIAANLSRDGRLYDLFNYCKAGTGRWAGQVAQPQNLPSAGPKVRQCDEISGCGRFYRHDRESCPWCGTPDWASDPTGWCPEAVDDAAAALQTEDYNFVQDAMGDPLLVISGSLRGLFVAKDGHEFISSDFSAIEAVVLAMVSNETWRIEVFRTHGMIYEMSAAKISGIPFDDFKKHALETGDHHPLRKKIGKVAELASGYQGGYGAWLNFGADKHLSEEEIRAAIKKWRAESPNIVNFWYGVERAAISAVQNPGSEYQYNCVTFFMTPGVLHCRLPSGRTIQYHKPVLRPDKTPWGSDILKLTYWGWNSDSTKGPVGWFQFDTYGGKLTENIVQAIARDIQADRLVALERSGFPVVLHVHDEIVSECPIGQKSLEEFETIMSTMPTWCADWPVKASGGWVGRRFRKD